MQGEKKGQGEVSRNSSAAAAGDRWAFQKVQVSRAAGKKPGLPHCSAQQPSPFAGTRVAAAAGTGFSDASGTG